jgi:hypothetical protein
MEAEAITFALDDRSGGYAASPQRVRLETLTRFTADVERLLKGSGRELDGSALEVSVETGSLVLRTAAFAAPPGLLHDLRLLAQGELLDALDVRRREVIERWQKLARQTPDLAYRISAPFLPRPVVVDAGTDYRADDADQWVQVERYLTGEIQEIGGAARANAHLRLANGSTLIVSADRDVLRDDQTNRLYKPATLRIRAQYNVVTQELRDARLVEFVPYAPRFDAAEIERLTRRGAQAWKDVPHATAWVQALRGEEA